MPVLVEHPRLRFVDAAVLTTRFVPDCMAHPCRVQAGGLLPDACCRYGADVGLEERDAILAHATEVASVLSPAWRDRARWFDLSDPVRDPDFPSGVVVRTALQGPAEDSGCVFLAHDARGCALHRAALAHGLEPSRIKPVVCRLFPFTFDGEWLGLSEDVGLYSCTASTGPTVYRVMRGTLAEVFGVDLVRQLDRAEAQQTRVRVAVASAE